MFLLVKNQNSAGLNQNSVKCYFFTSKTCDFLANFNLAKHLIID
jgi:hypothetical protein